jgi:hypothetical protein
LHAAVVAESRAVEGDLGHARRLRLLGDALADLGRGFLLRAVREASAHVLLERRGRGEHLAAGRVDHLRVDVLVRAVHREAHALLAPMRTRVFAARRCLEIFLSMSRLSPYFFLVSLITTFSSA